MVEWRKRIITILIIFLSVSSFSFAHQFVEHAGDISKSMYGRRSTALANSVSSSRKITVAERELERLRSKANAIVNVSSAAIDGLSVDTNLNNAIESFRNADISYTPNFEYYGISGGKHRAYNHQGYNYDYMDIAYRISDVNARYRADAWRYGKELLEDAIRTAYGTSDKMTKALAMQMYTIHMLGDIEEAEARSLKQMGKMNTASGSLDDLAVNLKYLASSQWWMSKEGRSIHRYGKSVEHLSKSMSHQRRTFEKAQSKLLNNGIISQKQYDAAVLSNERSLATKAKNRLSKISSRFDARNVPEIKQTQRLERMANNKWLNRLNSSKFADILRKPKVQKSLKIGGRVLVVGLIALQYKDSVMGLVKGELTRRQFLADVTVITGVNVVAIGIGNGIGYLVGALTPIPGDGIILSIAGETIGFWVATKIFNPIADHFKLSDMLLSIGEDSRIIYKWTDDYLARAGL